MKKFLLFLVPVIIFLNTNLLAQYKLTMNFESMDPHKSQMLEIRVVDKGTGLEVGRSKLDVIPGGEFKMELYVLLPDSSYRIDFYVDFNKNGSYDAPPADHAWSLDADNVSGDTELTFVHNTDFTTIEFPAPLNFADFAGDWEGIWNNPTYNVDGKVAGTLDYNEAEKTLTGDGQAWGIFGNPLPVGYTLDGVVSPDESTVTFTANSPWSGSIVASNGQISGTVDYPMELISAEVKGNYGLGQAIFYYHMTGAFDAEEYAVFKRDVQTNTSVSQTDKSDKPVDFKLYANFPNPFNPDTKIRFDVPVESYVNVEIYNMLGKKIRSLLNENKSAGSHLVSWNGLADNGSSVASGLYFYRLEATSINGYKFVKMNKMSLIK